MPRKAAALKRINPLSHAGAETALSPPFGRAHAPQRERALHGEAMTLRTVPKREIESGTLSTDEKSVTLTPDMPGLVKPMSPYSVPSEEAFDEADYLPAPDLEKIIAGLINTHETLFSHLVNLKLTCLWKAKGGASKGKTPLSKIQVASGLIGFFSEADFIIALSADHLRKGRAGRHTVEAVCFHELCHIQYPWDAEGGKVFVVGHDFEGFTEELKVYGAWRTELDKAGKAFAQLGLWVKEEAAA